ncbi:MAG: osmotically inducible protein OsmC [Bacteroidetes bacterium GWF2_38_335]|nr:MAG: osmotically inducible protein OsmC [Bacteroidetes bacterium GWF2_38_335]OFY79383.1 MAG: osmotically inducible protein OsmC [Bacteroidetes bacterium RIFOXYA12_FULL_38_20]HBS85647.1 osmotically inducible protein OsmC [Bacteroidales bacterium]
MEITLDGGKVVTAHLNGHTIKTDQPTSVGGTNTAPTPFDLFLASIGTCAGIYVKLFCDQRGISAEGIKIIQSMEYNHDTGLPVNIKLDIKVPEGFPEKYIDSLIKVADMCKVKKTIASMPAFEVHSSVI